MKELRNYSCLLAYPIIASYYCSVEDMMGLEKNGLHFSFSAFYRMLKGVNIVVCCWSMGAQV